MIPASRRKTEKNKKLITGIAAGVAALVGVAVTIWLVVLKDDPTDMTSGEQTSELQTISEQESTAWEISDTDTGKLTDINDNDSVDKEKEYYVDFVDLAVLQNGTGVFDIHIRFPDGEDYVVVTGVVIEHMTEEGFFVSLTDRENHMLSSAQTDMEVYTGTELYLSRYEAAVSGTAVADYPWNHYVLGAHGLDDTDKETVYARRMQLEENLAQFMNQTLNR